MISNLLLSVDVLLLKYVRKCLPNMLYTVPNTIRNDRFETRAFRIVLGILRIFVHPLLNRVGLIVQVFEDVRRKGREEA